MLAVLLVSLPALAANGLVKVTVYEAAKSGESTEPLPGATVQLSEANAQMQPLTLVTDVNGEALFPVVPVGSTYVVTVSMPGYAPTRITGVVVRGGIETPVPLALVPELAEVVDVIGRAQVVELDQGTANTTEISGEFFQDLPVFGREYQNVLDLAAGVQDSDGDGNPNVHGSREQDFQMVVDGVSNVDPLTGERFSSINPDAIDEVQIVDSGADATFGGAIGGFGRITLKTGGNEFEGSATLYFRDSVFDGDGAGGRQPLDFYEYRPAFLFSGPIVRDKLWFLTSHEMIKAAQPIDLLGGPDFVQDILSFTNIDQLTWQASPKDKLQLRYQSNPVEIEPAGVDSVTPPGSGYRQQVEGPTVAFIWRNQFSGTLFFETVASYADIKYRFSPFDPEFRNECVSGLAGSLEDSTLYCINRELNDQVTGAFWIDQEEERSRWAYQTNFEKYISDFLGGSHRVTGAFGFARSKFLRDTDRTNYFVREDVFRVGSLGPGGNEGVPDKAITEFFVFPGQLTSESRGNSYVFAINDSFEIRSNLVLNVGVRVTREELTSDGYTPIDVAGERAQFDAVVEQCIANRAGCINPRTGEVDRACLSSCVGQSSYVFTAMPFDNPDLYPACSVATNRGICELLRNARFGANQVGESLKFRNPERFTITNNDIEPRISISWDPWNNNKTSIAASWSRFVGDTFLNPLVSELGPDTTTDSFYIDGDGSPIPNSRPQPSGAFVISEVDRNLERQYTDEWAFRFEREIASETSFVFRYLNRKYKNQFQDVDANRTAVYYDELFANFPNQAAEFGDCRRIGEFADCTGRVVYDPLGGGGLGGQGGTRPFPDGVADLQLVSPMMSSLYRIGNFNESQYEAYILELVRRFYQNWEFRASYTWSESLGQAETFAAGEGDDVTNADDEVGPLSTDQRHVFTAFGRVYIPRWGGFRLGGVLNYQTGLPYSIISPRTVFDFPTNFSGIDVFGAPSTFYSVQRQVFPTGQRNDQRNASLWDLEVNIQKEFSIKDVRATVQLSVYNVLNDDTLFISRVQQNEGTRTEISENGEIIEVPIVFRSPVGGRRFGRQFELLLKANF